MTVPAIPTTINGRWELLLPEHRAARPQWQPENGGWETERLDSMYANLRPGMLVYDVGAEEGDLPALWASWGCQVVLFEPNPRVWPNIRFIFEANGLPAPLGCFVGFAADHSGGPPGPPGNWPARGEWPACADGPLIGDHGFCNLSERPDIARITIDGAATQHGPPDAITIDVEGSELRVLRGAEATLAEHGPLVWVSVHPEFMAEMYGEHSADLHRYMADLGYEGRHLATDHEQHWLFVPPGGTAR